MALKSFRQIQCDDEVLNRIQDNISSTFQQIVITPLLGGNLLQNIPLASGGVNEVNHLLGRQPVGWILTRNQANAVIWDSQNTNANYLFTLNLNASANTTVDLWVF